MVEIDLVAVSIEHNKLGAVEISRILPQFGNQLALDDRTRNGPSRINRDALDGRRCGDG